MAKQSGDRTHSHAFLETTCELALKGQGTGCVLPSPECPQAFCRAVLSHRRRAAVGTGRLSKAFLLSGCTYAQPGTKPGPLSRPLGGSWPDSLPILAVSSSCPSQPSESQGQGGLRHPYPPPQEDFPRPPGARQGLGHDLCLLGLRCSKLRLGGEWRAMNLGTTSEKAAQVSQVGALDSKTN